LDGETVGVEGAVEAIWVDVEGLDDDADGGWMAFVWPDVLGRHREEY
jgi:hypothetical protein